MKMHASLLAAVLSIGSFALAQQPGQEGRTPPTFPEGRQTNPANPETMPPDQPAPPNPSARNPQSQSPGEARGEQNQGIPGESQTVSEFSNTVQQAIASDSMLESSDVKVSVKGDELELTGTVPTQQAKDRAEQIAAPFATRNDLKVVNHISVRT